MGIFAVFPDHFNGRVSMKWFVFTLRVAILFAFVSALLLHPVPAAANIVIRHVTPDGGVSGDCSDSSWSAPCTLQYALSISQPGDEIWVTAGTYLPATNGDKEKSFALKSGVAVYGGFVGGELSREDRHWRENITNLSGDLQGNDSGTARGNNPTLSDNSYHVVTAVGVTSTTVLDGFTIHGGTAGGGSFSDDPFSGGGISLVNSDPLVVSSPILRNLIIAGNTASIGNGGGLSVAINCSPRLINVLFSGNTAGFQGGAIHVQNGEPILTGVTLSGNEAAASGGAISSFYGTIVIRNSIVWGNTAPYNRSMMVMNPKDIPVLTYSDVEDGCPPNAECDSTNSYVDPIFFDAPGLDGFYGTPDDNPRLQGDSPLIDQGNNNVADPSLPATDLDGRPRIKNGIVDMGAFEHQVNIPPVSNDQTFKMFRNHIHSGQLEASDVDGEQLFFQLFGETPAGNLQLHEDGSFIYAPVYGFIGTISFQFKVSDQNNDPVGPYTATISVLYPVFLPAIIR
jgi:predicted outer membrane repeat protein